MYNDSLSINFSKNQMPEYCPEYRLKAQFQIIGHLYYSKRILHTCVILGDFCYFKNKFIVTPTFFSDDNPCLHGANSW